MPIILTSVIYAALSGIIVFLCRALPFILLTKNPIAKRHVFVFISEKIIPPVSMSILALSSIISPIKETPALAFPVITASILTAVLHLLKQNVFLSIAGGTLSYMILIRIMSS